jgi:hypothetical protein
MKSYTIQKPTILYAKDLKNLLYDTHSKRILVFNFYIKYYCFFFKKKIGIRIKDRLIREVQFQRPLVGIHLWINPSKLHRGN